MKRITIRDVAREAKVSVTLVSFVMNAKRDKDGNLDCPVNADTAKRVLQVAQRLGYRRNFAAASLRSGRSNSIAVIPNDISNKFFAGISRCIEDKAKSYGYTVLFASSDESAERLESVMDAVLAHNIDGVIVAPCTGGEAAIRKATDAGVPVVLLDRDIEDMENVGKVLLDDQEAGKMATELFLKNGYKNVDTRTPWQPMDWSPTFIILHMLLQMRKFLLSSRTPFPEELMHCSFLLTRFQPLCS